MVKEYLINLGYSNEDTENILNSYALKNLKEDTLLIHIKENYNLLIFLGYSHEDIVKMTKSLPALYSYSIENIKQKIDDLISLGYSHEDVIKMTKFFPSLYGLNIENIKQKIDDLISLGYGHEDVIKMTKTLPTLYGLNIENINQKLTFLREMHLDFIVVEDTKKLMQSIDLTYARYVFFKEKGIEITKDNYRRLFYDAKRFEKQYGIDKSTLLEKYNYQEYVNSKNKDNSI